MSSVHHWLLKNDTFLGRVFENLGFGFPLQSGFLYPAPPCFPCDLVSEADYNPKTSALSYFTSQAFLCLGFCTCCSSGLQDLLLFLPHRLTCPNLLFWLIRTHSPGQPSRNSLPQTRAGTSLELYARLFSVIAHDRRLAFLPCRSRSAASRLDLGTALCLFLKP